MVRFVICLYPADDVRVSISRSTEWSNLIKLYPSNSNLSSLLSREELRKVSDKHIMSKLCCVIHPCNKETLINSWAATQFKFQRQKVKDDRLGPGLISMSPQKYNKILIYNKKSISTSTSWRMFVKKRNLGKEIK